MHPLQRLATGHGIEQAVHHQRLQVLLDQMVDQPCTAVAVAAALGEVRDQPRAMAELQLATLQSRAWSAFNSTNSLYPGVFPSIRKMEAEIERLNEDLHGWKTVAVISATPLEAMRMAGSYRLLAPSTQACVDEAVVTIRMAVTGHSLPPNGDIDAALAPARAALAATDHPASSEEASDVSGS